MPSVRPGLSTAKGKGWVGPVGEVLPWVFWCAVCTTDTGDLRPRSIGQPPGADAFMVEIFGFATIDARPVRLDRPLEPRGQAQHALGGRILLSILPGPVFANLMPLAVF